MVFYINIMKQLKEVLPERLEEGHKNKFGVYKCGRGCKSQTRYRKAIYSCTSILLFFK